MRAIRVREYGDAGVLRVEQVQPRAPGPREALVRVAAAGVNFVDIYYRTGEYRSELPMTPGMEAAGVVEAVGAEVTSPSPGTRVAFAMYLGAYAEQVIIPADRLVVLPDGVSARLAASCLLQGMTAHFLGHDLYPTLGPDDVVLVHAAAGGLGQALVQTLKARGVRVVGTVSSPEKAAVAEDAGTDHVINYRERDFADEVAALTHGRGVTVVYDSVGRDTWRRSLACVRPRGLLALCGQASGPVEPVDPQLLRHQGSVMLARPSLTHYIANPDELAMRAGEVFAGLQSGRLRVRVEHELPLAEAAAAHRLLESRRVTGKIVLSL